jgi:hypothetical protein
MGGDERYTYIFLFERNWTSKKMLRTRKISRGSDTKSFVKAIQFGAEWHAFK